MSQVFTLLINSFVISSRNFTLVYILLFSLLILESLISLAGVPTLTWQWLLFGAIMLLLFAAIMAGWFNMVAQACERFLGVPKTEALTQNHVQESMRLFKSFFPGIGQYFGAVSVVYSLHGAILLGLGVTLQTMWHKVEPLIMKAATLPLEQRETFVSGLSATQKTEIGEFSLLLLAGLMLYGIFSVLTLLWPTYIIYYGQSGLKACLSSVFQIFRDPLRVFGLIALLACIGVPLFLSGGLIGTSNLLLGITLQFLNLLAQVFFTVVIFVYAYQVIGKPVSPADPEEENPDSFQKTPPEA